MRNETLKHTFASAPVRDFSSACRAYFLENPLAYSLTKCSDGFLRKYAVASLSEENTCGAAQQKGLS
jgi:hypothetical protein